MSVSCNPTMRLLDRVCPPLRRGRARAGVKRWLLTLCLLCGLCSIPASSSAQTWQEKTSTHFRVFYQQNPAFAAAVLEYAEAYYSQIRLDLGLTHVVQRDQVPWLWDKRCQIYLYPNRLAYRQATGAPAWSSGWLFAIIEAKL
jgi:hypothetical protein